ncbi:ShlB/FhaC/HecB family hemolysin secretion/activation protein [Parasulfuritortus cantonensis]|uniref:ShlB/FhaC/HecB family hemolysin secretion/activation protein n=1 Tax=Parasulfuritortus cantonensis TaxID=2528202 RepID=A0A4R1BSM6_9PROT|nr:ShlB/FhaC/HecB family hemolysin secretion/activation protein [Parasulfuritortus cantonensis]TCJ20387.1 ShlB/FhaC/HecB family hemolysin secretion/activation protein [Parasulfuritortus cantonensis]
MQKKQLCIAMGMTTLGVLATMGNAMAVDPPNAGMILESVKEAPPAPKPADQVLEKPAEPSKAATGMEAGPSVKVTGFHFTGNTVYSEAQLQAQLAEYQGKELNLDGLNEAADVIKSFYRQHEYFLAQAILPPQEIKDGVVHIQVVEGAIGKAHIKMAEGARLKESMARKYMDTMLPTGTLITETGIEKPLLLLNDLPGVTVRSTIRPGVETGQADMDVVVGDEGKRFGGDVQVDNWGNRNSGKLRVTGDFEARNLTGYGDLLSIRGLYADDKGTTLARLAYTLPVGSAGTKLTASYSDLTYKLSGTFSDLDADGDAKVSSLLAVHPFNRSRNNNLFGLLGYDNKRMADRQFDGATEDKRTLNNIWFGLTGDYRDDLGGGALNTYTITLTGGDVDITSDGTADNYDTEGKFAKLNVSYQRLQHVADNTALMISLAGQLANKNLAAVEQMSLGGPRGVRSHPVGEGAGDDAVLATLELRRVIPSLRPLGGTLQVSAFTDFGYSKLHHDPLPSDDDNTSTLFGYGVGVNLGKRGDFLMRMDVAFRDGEPSTDDSKRARLWAQAIKWF